MKAIYEEFFHVPATGKVRDKVMLGRAVVTLLTVLLFLGAMSITAYAYFMHSISSEPGAVEAAVFKVDITVSATDTAGTTTQVVAAVSNKRTVDMDAGKTYTICLKPAGTANTGFCTVKATGNDTAYHTQQLGADAAVNGGRTEQIVFTVTPTGNTSLTFVACWGTSSYYGKVSATDERYIHNEDELTVSINGASMPDPDDTQPEQSQTEQNPTETTPETTQETTQATQPDTTQSTEGETTQTE